MFLAPEINYCLTTDEYTPIEKHKPSNVLTDLQKLINREQYFESLKGDETYAKLPLSWKKSLMKVLLYPKKARYCTECKKDSICGECKKIIR